MTTILVVEDNKELKSITGDMFRELGYEVIEALNGAEAIQRLDESRKPINVLFTDYVMPGRIRSVDIANEVRKRFPYAVVIFASGYPMIDKDVLGNAFEIQKPYMIADVHNLIQRELKI